jgi:hypothetical protein
MNDGGLDGRKDAATSPSLEWLAALLTRLFLGYFFFETDWAKVQNLYALPCAWWCGASHIRCSTRRFRLYRMRRWGADDFGLATRFALIAMIINMTVSDHRRGNKNGWRTQ